MKPIEPLIQTIYEDITSLPDLMQYLGVFQGTDIPALAYRTVPEEYTLPEPDKAFIVFNVEVTAPRTSETRAVLEEVILKFYVGGYDASAIVDYLRVHYNGIIIYNYYISNAGTNTLADGNISIRFTLI